MSGTHMGVSNSIQGVSNSIRSVSSTILGVSNTIMDVYNTRRVEERALLARHFAPERLTCPRERGVRFVSGWENSGEDISHL